MRSPIPLLFLAVLPALACGGPVHGNPAVDPPVAARTAELLDLAFRAASALPDNPHRKTRTRLQEEVALAWLRLGQTRRAAELAARISDWRSGAAFAAVALHCAQAGAGPEARRYLELAAAVAERPDVVGDNQEWRRDRIRIGIARTYTLLGQHEEAERFAAGAVEHERGKLDSMKAVVSAPAALDEQIENLQSTLARGDLDQQRNALAAAHEILTRSWHDPARRARVEAMIRSALARLPAAIAVEVMTDLAGLAVTNGDHPAALAVLAEARKALDAVTWLPEDRIPLDARLAVVRHRAGDPDNAARELTAAQAAFAVGRAVIVDIYRARVLRALAEAWHAVGNHAAALTAWRSAVEEGIVNPNSRPRADDLCSTCCSMATAGAAPEAELVSRMHEILARLGDPW